MIIHQNTYNMTKISTFQLEPFLEESRVEIGKKVSYTISKAMPHIHR